MKMSRWILFGLFFPFVSFAEEAAHGAAAGMSAGSGIALAAGLGISLAVVGATTAQGRIASAFLEGASRNPGAADGMKTPLILGLAFIESLVLFTVLIAFMLIGKM